MQSKSWIWSIAWTAVVGSFTAGDNAMIAVSTRRRNGYFGSCSKVRSDAKTMPCKREGSEIGALRLEHFEQYHSLADRITDAAFHKDRAARFLGQLHEVIDPKVCDRQRHAVVGDSLLGRQRPQTRRPYAGAWRFPQRPRL